jgi:hypothetical protein
VQGLPRNTLNHLQLLFLLMLYKLHEHALVFQILKQHHSLSSSGSSNGYSLPFAQIHLLQICRKLLISDHSTSIRY